jgi:hypothetical protein
MKIAGNNSSMVYFFILDLRNTFKYSILVYI